VDAQNVRMIEGRNGASFLFKSVQAVSVFDKCFGKDLDRDVPTETRVFGAVDFTRSAGVDGSDDFDDERVDELAPGAAKVTYCCG